MAMMNFGMGSPTAWTPERQTSNAVQTPEEMKAAFDAQIGQFGGRSGPSNIQPGRDDIMNSYAWDVAQASGRSLGMNPDGLYGQRSNMFQGLDPNANPDAWMPDFLTKWNAAPEGSSWGAIQDANSANATRAAQEQAARAAFGQKMKAYGQAQQNNQNGFSQQTGGGFVGGIMPDAQRQPTIDPMAVGASAQSGPVAPITPTWGGWGDLNLPQGYGQPGGLGGLGGQPSASLGGPFGQKNPWSLA